MSRTNLSHFSYRPHLALLGLALCKQRNRMLELHALVCSDTGCFLSQMQRLLGS